MARNSSPRAFYGKALAALLPVLLVLALGAIGLRADPPSASANPDFVHALWVAEVDRIIKLGAADGKTLLEITDAREPKTVAADEARGIFCRFWGYSHVVR